MHEWCVSGVKVMYEEVNHWKMSNKVLSLWDPYVGVWSLAVKLQYGQHFSFTLWDTVRPYSVQFIRTELTG